MKKNHIFLNGRIVEADTKLLESLKPGVIQGRGVFETVRVCRGKSLFLDRHMDRMSRSLKVLKLRPPLLPAKIAETAQMLLKKNGLKDARLRVAVWKENNKIKVSIVCEKFPPIPARKYQEGMRVGISRTTRPKTIFSRIKLINYGCFRQALLEARDKGFEEAILLNTKGELVEGARTNIFFVRGGILYTPAVRCGCLNGVTRQIVLHCARQEGIPRKVQGLMPRDLLSAEEAFCTNSLIGVMPVTHVSGSAIGDGRPGPVTLGLLQAYIKVTDTFGKSGRDLYT